MQGTLDYSPITASLSLGLQKEDSAEHHSHFRDEETEVQSGPQLLKGSFP